MGGGKKKTAEQSLPYPGNKWMTEARDLRANRAQEFEDEAAGRRNVLLGREEGAYGDLASSRAKTEAISRRPLQDRLEESSYGRGREYYSGIAGGGITGASYGRGRETYEDLANTGGFTPESTALFMRSATSPFASIYSSARRELARRRSVQGGYAPTFGSEGEKLTRRAAQDIAEGTLGARAEMEKQKRDARIEGAGGLERTREAAGKEFLEGVGGLERTRRDTGIEAQEEGRQTQKDVELGQGQQRIDLDSAELAQVGLTQSDTLRLKSRLESGALDAEDINLLARVREQAPSLFDRIMQGVQIGAEVISAIGGLPGGGGK